MHVALQAASSLKFQQATADAGNRNNRDCKSDTGSLPPPPKKKVYIEEEVFMFIVICTGGGGRKKKLPLCCFCVSGSVMMNADIFDVSSLFAIRSR